MQAPTRRFARALLTNDDGIEAPGLAALAEAAADLADEIWVVAPEHDQSGTSRAISLHDPLRVYGRGRHRFSVGGTPSDCAILAIRSLMRDAPPDIVLSGVNRGANIGQEVAYSGTVSAALAAKLMGVPAIAFSQAFRDRTALRWDTAVAWIPRVFNHLDRFGGLPDTVLNVNFPDVPPDEVEGFAFTRQATNPMMMINVDRRTDTRGADYYWMAFGREPGEQAEDSDVTALRHRKVSITPVGFDLTDEPMLRALRDKA